MRIATFVYQNRRQLGLVNADGRQITAFAADQIDASQCAMALVQRLSSSGLPTTHRPDAGPGTHQA